MKKIDMFLENLITIPTKRVYLFISTYFVAASSPAIISAVVAVVTPMTLAEMGGDGGVGSLIFFTVIGWFFFPSRFGWPITTFLFGGSVLGNEGGNLSALPCVGIIGYFFFFLAFLSTKSTPKAKAIFYIFVAMLIFNIAGCAAQGINLPAN